MNRSTQDDLSFLDDRTQVVLLAKAEADPVQAMSKLLPNPGTEAEAGETLNSNRTASIPLRSIRSPREPKSSSSTAVQTYARTSAATFLPVVPPTVQASADTPHSMPKANVRAAIFEKPHGEAANIERSSVTPKSSPSPQNWGEFDFKIASEQSTQEDTPKQWRPRLRDAAKDVSSGRTHVLSQHLDHCASAVSRLSTVTDEAKRDLQMQNNISMSSIHSSLRSTKRASTNLAGGESDLDSDPDMPLARSKHPSTNWRHSRSPAEFPPGLPRLSSYSFSTERSVASFRDDREPMVQHENFEAYPPHEIADSKISLEGDARFSATVPAASPSRSIQPSSAPMEQLDVSMERTTPLATRFRRLVGRTVRPNDDTEVFVGFETVDDLVRKWTHVSPG